MLLAFILVRRLRFVRNECPEVFRHDINHALVVGEPDKQKARGVNMIPIAIADVQKKFKAYAPETILMNHIT